MMYNGSVFLIRSGLYEIKFYLLSSDLNSIASALIAEFVGCCVVIFRLFDSFLINLNLLDDSQLVQSDHTPYKHTKSKPTVHSGQLSDEFNLICNLIHLKDD